MEKIKAKIVRLSSGVYLKVIYEVGGEWLDVLKADKTVKLFTTPKQARKFCEEKYNFNFDLC